MLFAYKEYIKVDQLSLKNNLQKDHTGMYLIAYKFGNEYQVRNLFKY